MTQEQPPLRATQPAFVVSDAIEAVTLSLDLLSELQLTGLEQGELLDLHVMLVNLNVSIAELLVVSSRQASEAASALWAASYERREPQNPSDARL